MIEAFAFTSDSSDWRVAPVEGTKMWVELWRSVGIVFGGGLRQPPLLSGVMVVFLRFFGPQSNFLTDYERYLRYREILILQSPQDLRHS
jgi:hypothetical protein